MRFEVREPHLDALAIVPRLLEGFCAGMRPRNVARAFVDAAGDSFGTAPSDSIWA